MPTWLALCDIGAPGWGNPGFRTVLCCFFSHLLYGGHRYVPCPFALFLAIPILWMMQSHYLNNCADGPFFTLPLVFLCVCCGRFLVCCLVWCCFCLPFWFCVDFIRHRDGLSGLCTGPPSARPLVAHLLTKMDEFQCNN